VLASLVLAGAAAVLRPLLLRAVQSALFRHAAGGATKIGRLAFQSLMHVRRRAVSGGRVFVRYEVASSWPVAGALVPP